ncbi:uncharacterized protein MYCFIDRAFT_178234 [Pseudocercospora fijiensis CIRAD86]|uniref:Uncharacterized protein n=1 Tax=Pseudocercospora fijiensis (strain CIRAD86) TaxID=383855 RepID=M3AQE5_PSEFD|nr:uncharacterized protein MYCFIDRAFT_178234 [Pseudocercospora fijiensis CIRAD86]EME79652.1 hypothetical protein MYCFIDRAFT_178234 [Pseudocercospora fijiensis CIRAD86]
MDTYSKDESLPQIYATCLSRGLKLYICLVPSHISRGDGHPYLTRLSSFLRENQDLGSSAPRLVSDTDHTPSQPIARS